ncbi:outer membrane beta-barrel protein [Aegicerativicinus sediminis]|uniref:outer membrane beta-barrel protein n=1 Tax=Aegicerativicinus sediminis TaxID=2893202 RepID=UPI001E2E44ED|nr:outer membrane beta-barrel protein [Aegicerativicinus sediminis]
MKKLFFLLIVIFGLHNAFSQEGFKLALNAGLPMGDASDHYMVNLSADIDYLFHVTEEIHFGIATGYSHFIAKSSEETVDDFSFIPIGGTAQFNISDDFIVGTDIGFGVGIMPKENDGGFFYAPRVQYAFNENLDLVLSYQGLVTNSVHFNALSIGLEFYL